MKSGSHDYVDTPYWSVMQIRVKRFLAGQKTNAVGELKTFEENGDLGKVN